MNSQMTPIRCSKIKEKVAKSVTEIFLSPPKDAYLNAT